MIKAALKFIWDRYFILTAVLFSGLAGCEFSSPEHNWPLVFLDANLAILGVVGFVLTEVRRMIAPTPVEEIVDQLNERRPLPLGRRDFQEWAHRIITGAMLPVVEGEDPIAFIEGQKFALATMIMHLGPTESHKPDAYFIHSLRKSASNQVAHTILQEIKLARMEKAKKEAEAKADVAQVTMSE